MIASDPDAAVDGSEICTAPKHGCADMQLALFSNSCLAWQISLVALAWRSSGAEAARLAGPIPSVEGIAPQYAGLLVTAPSRSAIYSDRIEAEQPSGL
jgi:hypothetical protein